MVEGACATHGGTSASPIDEQVGFILVIAFFPAFIHGNGLGRQGKSPLKNWLDFSS